MQELFNIPLLPIEAIKVMLFSVILWVYVVILFEVFRSAAEVIFAKKKEPVEVEEEIRLNEPKK